MEKYKFRSTVYLVFLLVSLFINGLLLYMLIFDDTCYHTKKDVKNDVDYDELVGYATASYEGAYNMLNGENSNFRIPVDYVSLNYPTSSCVLINFNGFEKYFTNKLISELMEELVEDTGVFYDCNNSLDEKLFEGLFGTWGQGLRKLTFVSSSADTLLVSGKLEYSAYSSGDRYPLYMVLKKVDDKWLIDSFE